MFDLDKFISDSVTFRLRSIYLQDIEANWENLTQEIKGKEVCTLDARDTKAPTSPWSIRS